MTTVRSIFKGFKMRKRLKQKLRSCAMCKPHKMHYANRWKPREEALLKAFEHTKQQYGNALKDLASL